MIKDLFLIITAIVFFNCSNSINETGERDSWNLLGGTNEKTGEMIVWRGYWVEAYKDTVTNIQRILLVNKDNKKTISDSLNLGALNMDEGVDYGTVEVNEQEDREIVALFKIDDSLYHKNITKAWRANTETGKFEPCSTMGIRVKNIKKLQ